MYEYFCRVSNLSPQTSNTSLRRAFENYVPVIRAKVIRDRNDVSRGFGYVTFENEEHMVHAIRQMNGKILQGSPIDVRRGRQPSNYPDGNFEHDTSAICSHCGGPGHTVSECYLAFGGQEVPGHGYGIYDYSSWPWLLQQGNPYGSYGSSSWSSSQLQWHPWYGWQQSGQPWHGYGTYNPIPWPLSQQPLHTFHGYGTYSPIPWPLSQQPQHPFHGYGTYNPIPWPLSQQPQHPQHPFHGYGTYGAIPQPLFQQQQEEHPGQGYDTHDGMGNS